MPMTAERFLKDVDSLVSLTDVCFRVNQMADDPTSNAKDIAEVVGRDPNLTAQVLRIANSSYYGFPSKVETITRAISVIGTQDLRNLVLSASVINAFSMHRNELIDIQKYWAHSLFTGFVARQLSRAASTKVLDKERFFVAGLLHDIGQLVFSMKVPEMMRIILHRSQADIEPFHIVEKLVFGLGHCELGAELLKKWQLPDSLQAVARYHHEPEKAKEYLLEVNVVHIANAMAHQVNMSGLGKKERVEIADEAWKITGLTEQLVVSAVEKAKPEFLSAMPAFITRSKAANQ